MGSDVGEDKGSEGGVNTPNPDGQVRFGMDTDTDGHTFHDMCCDDYPVQITQESQMYKS